MIDEACFALSQGDSLDTKKTRKSRPENFVSSSFPVFAPNDVSARKFDQPTIFPRFMPPTLVYFGSSEGKCASLISLNTFPLHSSCNVIYEWILFPVFGRKTVLPYYRISRSNFG